jgi:phage shock protein E
MSEMKDKAMLVMVFALLALVLLVVILPKLQQTSLSSEELRALLERGAVVIDVRSPEEFAGGSAPGAVNLPLGRIEVGIGPLAPDRAVPLILFCASGARSASAARQLRGLGYDEVINLGGLGRARALLQAAAD